MLFKKLGLTGVLPGGDVRVLGALPETTKAALDAWLADGECRWLGKRYVTHPSLEIGESVFLGFSVSEDCTKLERLLTLFVYTQQVFGDEAIRKANNEWFDAMTRFKYLSGELPTYWAQYDSNATTMRSDLNTGMIVIEHVLATQVLVGTAMKLKGTLDDTGVLRIRHHFCNLLDAVEAIEAEVDFNPMNIFVGPNSDVLVADVRPRGAIDLMQTADKAVLFSVKFNGGSVSNSGPATVDKLCAFFQRPNSL